MTRLSRVRIKIIPFLTGLLLMLTLSAKYEIISNGDYLSLFSSFIHKLSISFSGNLLVDVFVMISGYCFCNYIRKEENQIDIISCVVSMAFSLMFLLCKSYALYNGLALFTAHVYQRFYCLLLFCGLTTLFYFVIRLLSIYLKSHSISDLEERNLWTGRQVFILSFFVIFLCWSFWIVGNYPGSYAYDTAWQLEQFFSGDTSVWTTHHPPFSTFIMGSLVKIGFVVRNTNIGGFLYLLLQTAVGSAVFAYGLLLIKQNFSIKNKIILVCVAFYALTPLWGCFAQWFEKDLLYTELAALQTIIMIPIIRTQEISVRTSIWLFLSGFFASLLRNNGIYAVLPALFFLIVIIKGKNRIRIIFVVAATVTSLFLVNSILYPSLGIKKGSIKEALSIPFQQTARYVYSYENEVTEDERITINSVLDYDSLAEKYNPRLSDPIKSTYKEDSSKLKSYIGIWLKMFFKHPGCYLSALLNESYGYLAPVVTTIEPPIRQEEFFQTISDLGITKKTHPSLVDFLESIKESNFNMPLLKYTCMAGLYTWLLVLCIIDNLKRRYKKWIILFVPSIINVLVCVASPTAASTRYELPVLAVTPVLICVTIACKQTDTNDETEQETIMN